MNISDFLLLVDIRYKTHSDGEVILFSAVSVCDMFPSVKMSTR